MEEVIKPRTTFILKKPSEKDGRRSFSILKRVSFQGNVTFEKLKLDSIDTVNKLYQEGSQDLTACEKQARVVVEQLYKEERRGERSVVHNTENLAVLDRYWNQEYPDRNIVDKRTAYNDLRRAVEALGNISLVVATKKEITSQIKKHCPGDGDKQRRISGKINQLLWFLHRDFKINFRELDKRRKKRVKHLTIPEFQQVVTHIKDPFLQTLVRAAFGIGGRYGELFAYTEADVKVQHVEVYEQIHWSDGKVKETKNRRERKSQHHPPI
jgi:hypothetical protein